MILAISDFISYNGLNKTSSSTQFLGHRFLIYAPVQYHYEMYMGYICQAECNLPEAMSWWQKMLAYYQHKWQVWFEYGSVLATPGRYEEALEYFKKCQPMRPKPRFTDCEDAISQICVILGDIDGAIEAQKQMLDIMKEDWATEGESVDSILREIKRLEGLKN